MPQTLTGCPFCTLTDTAGSIGRHLDSFVREIASAKNTPYQRCDLHPEVLIRALRSTAPRALKIAWSHPSKHLRTVCGIYATALHARTPADLIATAIHRSELGEVDADWWMDRVLGATAELEAGRASKRVVQQIAQRDVDDAGSVLRRGCERRVVTPQREQGSVTIVTPLHGCMGVSGVMDRGASISRNRQGTAVGGWMRDARPAEASREGARREAWERGESDQEDEDDDGEPKSPSVRNYRKLAERNRRLVEANKKLMTEIKGKANEAPAAPEPAPPAKSKKHASAATPLTTPTANRSKIPRLKSPSKPKSSSSGFKHSITARPIETIVISSDSVQPDPPSSPPVFFHPIMTLRVENLNLPTVVLDVHADMQLKDVLDEIWSRAPAVAALARPFMALYSRDARFQGPWDEAVWVKVVAAGAAEAVPPVMVAIMGYVAV